MWHPTAQSHSHTEQETLFHTTQEEPRLANSAPGATTWKPLELSPVEHVQHKSDSSKKWTPFDADLPTIIPEHLYGNSNCGLHYSLYSLAHLSRDDVGDLLRCIRSHEDGERGPNVPKLERAPIYDFCSNKTLRDVYDYHVTLLEDGNHGVASGRFVVAAHSDWEAQGVLLVDFDCRPKEKGKLGIMRVRIGALPRCLTMLEASNRNWTDLKAAELDTKWPDPIDGYSESKWQTFGYGFYSDKWLKGEYGIRS